MIEVPSVVEVCRAAAAKMVKVSAMAPPPPDQTASTPCNSAVVMSASTAGDRPREIERPAFRLVMRLLACVEDLPFEPRI